MTRLPVGWKVRRLSELGEIKVSNVDKKSYPAERPVSLCNYMDVYANDYVTKDIAFMEATASPAEIANFSLQAGDVLLTKDSESPDDIGIPAVLVEPIEKLVCGYHLAFLRPDMRDFDPVFIAKQLSTFRVARYFAQNASGSTRFGLSVGALANTELLCPPKAHQVKIATVLSSVDKAIAQTERLIAKQQRIKAGLMQDLLTRGIDEHGNLRSEATHEFKDSPIGRIPVEWSATPIGSLADHVTSGSRGWARYYSVEGARFLRVGNLSRDHIDMRFDDEAYVSPPGNSEGRRTSLLEGDLLISITADLGMIGVVPSNFGEAYINQHLALIRFGKVGVCSRFLGYWLLSYRAQQQFQSLNESGAKAGLNLPTIERVIVPTTTMIDEQQRIAAILDGHAQALRKRHDALGKLRRLKSALMQDLLTGKVPVTPLLEAAEASA